MSDDLSDEQCSLIESVITAWKELTARSVSSWARRSRGRPAKAVPGMPATAPVPSLSWTWL
ncbi:hypothetical protein [Streptomyces beigongshangae]|uniref:hypothetical protein n=1 Tax=Streptomyces beigongshangae TaxID=2841597 RepID=UPI001C85AC8A|nr:hypothetical protein [Streptomyces sp. REN17]